MYDGWAHFTKRLRKELNTWALILTLGSNLPYLSLTMDVIRGIPVSPGIVIGPVFRLGKAEQQVPHRRISANEVESEVERVERAFEEAILELRSFEPEHTMS